MINRIAWAPCPLRNPTAPLVPPFIKKSRLFPPVAMSNPFVFTLPATSNFSAGVAVPIPIFCAHSNIGEVNSNSRQVVILFIVQSFVVNNTDRVLSPSIARYQKIIDDSTWKVSRIKSQREAWFSNWWGLMIDLLNKEIVWQIHSMVNILLRRLSFNTFGY